MPATPLIPVVLCGGSGTRLWPLSRESYPKQFLRLLGEDSLLQQTVKRAKRIPDVGAPILVCHESMRFIAAEHMREIGEEHVQILLEPVRRGTCPAICLATLHALTLHDDPVLLVLPSDHMMMNDSAFPGAVATAGHAARSGDLIMFGVTPGGAETGYGYIRCGASRENGSFRVLEFVEKPSREAAEHYVASGQYYWNSGMFLFRARSLIEELERHQPEVLDACRRAMRTVRRDDSFIRVDEPGYAASPDIAIDYAVMERTTRAAMVRLDVTWEDIGSWSSVRKVFEKDGDGNAIHGNALVQDCEDCLVYSTGRLVTAVGLKNVAIVETSDALLIMDADMAQEAKAVVGKLVAEKRAEASAHRQIFRPWGSYDSIGSGARFQVKRISVKQGAKLSLQLHHHRAEHWVVVSGTAKITNGDQEYLLSENQSTFIPVGSVHSLENPGKIPLELIEIQSGSYLGEDDIIRLQDRYGRA